MQPNIWLIKMTFFFIVYVVMPTSFWAFFARFKGKATVEVLVFFAWISHYSCTVAEMCSIMFREVSCQTGVSKFVKCRFFFFFCKNIREKKFKHISFTNIKCMCLMQTRIWQLHFVIISFYARFTGLESTFADNKLCNFTYVKTFQIKMGKNRIVDSMNRM